MEIYGWKDSCFEGRKLIQRGQPSLFAVIIGKRKKKLSENKGVVMKNIENYLLNWSDNFINIYLFLYAV